ncbi:hypothetical protein WJR50_16415 [Catalinimonas sp. 4WD22]|jgi:hypothetical protein|uniref:hypothetical protein n=1 Tax=Catalinimonas locisalis TaxID=3133978 RepID=UPI00310165C7
MEEKIPTAEVKLINVQAFKETHGLYINGHLCHLGTEAECTFMKLSVLGEGRVNV